MGAIEDVYEDLEAEVPFEDFEAAVQEKVEQMGGLADEETAAMLVAHELDDAGGEIEGIADIEAGMDEVKFLAKVVSVGELRSFERDEGDEDGKVINVEVADESGRVRLTFWDRMATSIEEGQLDVGDVVRVAGRPKEGYNGLEISVDKAEIEEDAEVDVQLLDTHRVEDLALGQSDVNLEGQVLDTDTPRTFDRDDGTEGTVSNLALGDETGRVRVTLWDEQADLATELSAGDSVEVVDGYVRERDGDIELHIGSRGAVEEIDGHVEYAPDTTDIADIEIGQTVDIGGGVIETSEKRTFDRDDGSEGQVRNVRVRDETDEIRVALWGEKADKDIELADRVVLTDVEIQEGWQDDLEASAGWRSTVTVTESGAAPAGESATSVRESGGSDRDAAGASLSSFGDDASGDGTGEDGASETDQSADAATGSGTTGASADGGAISVDADTEEFTGTVVQTGDPVVLDNGEKTRSVETDSELRLGEEVTVRGPMRDGRIDAEEIL
jgi:replication factor A1